MSHETDKLKNDWGHMQRMQKSNIGHASELFLETPSQETWNYIKHVAWDVNSVKKRGMMNPPFLIF